MTVLRSTLNGIVHDLVGAGDKIRFRGEAQAYTIQARSKRYLVCTKPFNARKTVLYTIVDLEKGVRGTENLIFGAGQETQAECYETLLRLEGLCASSGCQTEVSHRNRIPLDIEKIMTKDGKSWDEQWNKIRAIVA